MTKGCLSNVGHNLFRRKRNLALLPEREEERILIVHDGSEPLECPKCDRECPGYDHRRRRWRHLDSHGYPSLSIIPCMRGSTSFVSRAGFVGGYEWPLYSGF